MKVSHHCVLRLSEPVKCPRNADGKIFIAGSWQHSVLVTGTWPWPPFSVWFNKICEDITEHRNSICRMIFTSLLWKTKSPPLVFPNFLLAQMILIFVFNLSHQIFSHPLAFIKNDWQISGSKICNAWLVRLWFVRHSTRCSIVFYRVEHRKTSTAFWERERTNQSRPWWGAVDLWSFCKLFTIVADWRLLNQLCQSGVVWTVSWEAAECGKHFTWIAPLVYISAFLIKPKGKLVWISHNRCTIVPSRFPVLLCLHCHG